MKIFLPFLLLSLEGMCAAFFVQVGGDFSNTVITKHMKMFGRVVVIGIISSYNLTAAKTGWFIYLNLQKFTKNEYRSGTVNSKSFVGKVLLRIKWKFKLNNTL